MKEITLKQFDGYTYVEGGVCAAKGFKASGVYCGIKNSAKPDKGEPPKSHKNDIAMMLSDRVCSAAAVYTQNKVKGAPITVTKANLEKTGGKARAVIVNSGNANTGNADGIEKAMQMCSLTAEALGILPQEVIVASTGVIGQPLNIDAVKSAIKPLAEGLSYTGNAEAATAIMTTDTVKKEVAVQFYIGSKVCRIGGMGKGSGMIHPNMATTLNFITTDCAVSADMLQKALSEVVKVTYNCLSVDGDQSTNDMVCVMANGMAENDEIAADGEDFEVFKKALYIVMMNITRMLAKDGEGATKLLECTVTGAESDDSAIVIAKSVICSSLFKAAMFGEDANCGRILCAVGYADAQFDIADVDVYLSSAAGRLMVCEKGSQLAFSEEKAAQILAEDEIYIDISVGNGSGKATAYGCDLTYDYVKINGDYRT